MIFKSARWCWLLIGAIIVVPVFVFVLTLIPQPWEAYLTSDPTWLSFFGSYYGAVLTCGISFYILLKTIKSSQLQKEYEIRNEQLRLFVTDMVDAISIITDNDLICVFFRPDNKIYKNDYNVIMKYASELKAWRVKIEMLYKDLSPNIVSEYCNFNFKYYDQLLELAKQLNMCLSDPQNGKEPFRKAWDIFNNDTSFIHEESERIQKYLLDEKDKIKKEIEEHIKK